MVAQRESAYGYHIPVPYPTAHHLPQSSQSNPVLPRALYNRRLEQWACEQNHSQSYSSRGIDYANGEPPHEMQGQDGIACLARNNIFKGRQQPECSRRAQDTRSGDGGDATADDRGRITGQEWRGASCL